jgi:hypothetical protein
MTSPSSEDSPPFSPTTSTRYINPPTLQLCKSYFTFANTLKSNTFNCKSHQEEENSYWKLQEARILNFMNFIADFLCYSGSGSKLYHCKLSSDQRSLLFDPYDVSSSESGSTKSGSDEGRIRPVDISKVQYSEIFHSEEDYRKGEMSSDNQNYLRRMNPAFNHIYFQISFSHINFSILKLHPSRIWSPYGLVFKWKIQQR